MWPRTALTRRSSSRKAQESLVRDCSSHRQQRLPTASCAGGGFIKRRGNFGFAKGGGKKSRVSNGSAGPASTEQADRAPRIGSFARIC